MNNRTPIGSLCEELERLTGCTIEVKHIQSDRKGWLKYIPAKSLYRGRPLILSHFIGKLFVIVPHEDYHDLMREKITVSQYIEESVWHYGYFWGGGNIKSGVCWQTLEGGNPGISDTVKVKRFLTIMQCRTLEQHCGQDPSQAKICLKCREVKCPISCLESKQTGTSWEEEFPQMANHKRLEFYNVISQKLKERFNLKTNGLQIDESFDEAGENIYLVDSMIKGAVKIVFSQALYIDMMYFPEKYDVKEMIDNYGMIAALQNREKRNNKITFERVLKIEADTTEVELKEFWYGK